PAPFLEINPRDAQQLEVQGGEWVEVRSQRGSARLPLLVTQNIRRGTLFVPMHCGSLWAENAECNAITHGEVCPISGQPELKACAVQVVPLSRLGPDQAAAPEALPQTLESSILSAAPTP
ncbi:MAG: nitrate reductase catalytic subunit, partial [Leptolyngbya sp.]